jgi:hypothetical protein
MQDYLREVERNFQVTGIQIKCQEKNPTRGQGIWLGSA